MAIVNPGDSQRFNYTGGVQALTVPKNGIYKLEVWGGSTSCNYNGLGGYSVGYASLKNGQVLYICCGGSGAAGGYNGGGSRANTGSSYGAGATHIAKVNGTLAQIGYASFVNQGNGLIVAGGAGGYSDYDNYSVGGNAGGLNGSAGQDSAGNGFNGGGGTQTGGGGCPSQEGYAPNPGSFGQGGSVTGYAGGGGGGGFFGGGAGIAGVYGSGGGGGGSSWIGGVPTITYKGVSYSPTTNTCSSRVGNGYAIITMMAETFPTLYYNNTQLTSIKYNGIDVTDIYYNGTLLS